MVPCKRWICECLRSSGWFACVFVPCEAQRVPMDFPIPDKMAAELRHPIHIMRPSLYRCFVWRRGREWEGMCSRKTLISHLTPSLFSLSLSPLAMGYTFWNLIVLLTVPCDLLVTRVYLIPCSCSITLVLPIIYNTYLLSYPWLTSYFQFTCCWVESCNPLLWPLWAR